jgi:hypothetical protein
LEKQTKPFLKFFIKECKPNKITLFPGFFAYTAGTEGTLLQNIISNR